MPNSPRISRSPGPFNTYINHAVPYLKDGAPVKNAERLGIQEDEVTDLEKLLTEWSGLWNLYSDKKGSRTTNVTDQIYGKIDEMIEFDKTHHFLDRIASSMNVTIEDLNVFNIGSGRQQRGTSRSTIKSISDSVMPTLEQLGGAVVSIKCYSVESARPCIQSAANCVQIAYRVGGAAPLSPNDEDLKRNSSTRASFNYEFGPENSGKQLFIYFRWFNTVHPEIAGPWSTVYNLWLS